MNEELCEEKTTTVLVVDDEEVIRDIVRHHLEKEGFHVFTSENGEDAINTLKEHDISLAITDLKMPKVDGFGVLEYVKKHCSFIPVIVLTGYVDVQLAVSAMKKGCFDYITKPIKKEDLIDVVQNALSKMGEERTIRNFKIGEIYLLRDDGAIMFHEKIPLHPNMDAEFFGFVLTVIKTLIKNSSGAEKGLRGLEHADLKVLIEEGEGYFLTVIGQGDEMKPVKEMMRKTVEEIDQKYSNIITGSHGNDLELGDIETVFRNLIDIGRGFVDPNQNT